MEKREIGRTGLHVTPLMFGTSALGNRPGTVSSIAEEDRARRTVHAMLDSGINCLDTSNNYGDSLSEQRIGAVIRERAGLPDGFVLCTKLDRDPDTGRFDADRVRRSLEESLQRLGLVRIQMLHFHDPEHARDMAEITADDGAIAELFKLKEEGLVQATGLAMGRLDMMIPLVKAWPFDAILSHNRFTLTNRAADSLFDYAHAAGMGILNAAPFAGGMLAKGSAQTSSISYRPATDETLRPVQAVEALCARQGIAPGAAALQFAMNDPRISAVIAGVSAPEQVQSLISRATAEIPDDVRQALRDTDFSRKDPETGAVHEA